MDALALLRLQQIFDSQFPLGGFAHSWGIETYAQQRVSPEHLEKLVCNMVRQGWGKLDLAAAFLGHQFASNAAELTKLAAVVDATKLVPGPRNASLQMGRRMLNMMGRLYPELMLHVEPPHHCVVVGAAGGHLDIPQRDLLLTYGQSTAMGCLAAATRCMRLSPARAQEILTALQPEIIHAADQAMADPEAALYTCTPALDLRAHQQASLYSRLFQS
jgi:urease accessory protein